MSTARSQQCILFAGALLSASIVVGSLAPRPARAMVGGCVSDPVVILSDGALVHLYAVLPNTGLGDVRNVSYILVVPARTTVVRQVNTDGAMGIKEYFHYVATNPAGTYSTTTEVQTVRRGDPVTATTSITKAGASVGYASATVSTDSGSVKGEVYQSLEIHLHL